MKHTAAVFSGGAFKITFLAGAAYEILSHETKPKFYIGTSSGAIVALLSAMEMRDKLIDIRDNIDFEKIWKRGKPNTFFGTLAAFFRILMGKTYLYNQSGLKDLIKEHISEKDFMDWKSNYKSPNCYVGISYPETSTEEFASLKKASYNDAIDLIMASTSMPFFTKAVNIDGRNGVDGGLLSHIGSYFAASKFNVSRLISVFSRTDEAMVYFKYPKKRLFRIFNIVKVIERIYRIWSREVSRFDEFEADCICKEKGIKHYKVFTDFELNENHYSVTKAEKLSWFMQGVKNTHKSLTNGYDF